MEERYDRNMPGLSKQECESLADKRVCVVGCGGLGGYVVEMLARLGVGRLTVVDPDSFCESNLNRQLFSTEHNLGVPKVLAAFERIRAVNSKTVIDAVTNPLDDKTAASLLPGCDAAVDALDNIPARLLLSDHCHRLGIPLVHGAADGWRGQVATLPSGGMELIYQGGAEETPDPETGSLAFTVAMTASIQCAEVVRLLTGRAGGLSGRLLQFDLLEQDYAFIELF